MKDLHLTPSDLEPLLLDEAEVWKRLLMHHLALCPECYAVAGHLLDLYQAGEIEGDLCTVDVELSLSRRQAPGLFAKLEALLADESARIDAAAFRSWGLSELLCQKSEESASREPKRSLRLAELAVEIALLLEEWQPAERRWLDLLRAYTQAHLANARRVLGNLREAEEAFLAADRLWEPAIADLGDVLDYEARYLALKASLRRAERRLPEAIELLDQALSANAAPALRLRILISKAKALEERGTIEEALDILREAESEAGAEPDERVLLCLRQNYLDYLSKAERFVEAGALFPEVARLANALGSRLDRLRLRWTEARIARGLGQREEALEILEEVRETFAEEDLGYDMALASLELALMYAESGEREKTVGVLKGTLPTLDLLKVDREGLMALRLLSHAVQDERASAELIAQILDYLRRIEDERSLWRQ